VYAFREDAPDHRSYRVWLEGVVSGAEAFAVSDLVLSGMVRVVTHPRVFKEPAPVSAAIAFADAVRSAPNAVPISPGERHWEIFCDLCVRARARGNLVPDAYLAALAIESGSDWVSTDSDYARFPGLRWRHPLEATP